MERMVIYPGCLVLSRFPEYELASRRVLRKLGVEVMDMEEFCCCGSSLVPGVSDRWINLAAYSLAQGERLGADIVTLCGSCTNTFVRAKVSLEGDRELLRKVNSRLERLDLTYTGSVEVRHIVEVLIGRLELVRESVICPLNSKIALSHPCQIMRPSEIFSGQDGITIQTMRGIISALGAEVIDYSGEGDCCGSTILLFDRDMALEIGRNKLESAMLRGAEALCVCCGNCLLLLDRHQAHMELSNGGMKMPLVSLPQLIGQAFGFPQDEMGALQH